MHSFTFGHTKRVILRTPIIFILTNRLSYKNSSLYRYIEIPNYTKYQPVFFCVIVKYQELNVTAKNNIRQTPFSIFYHFSVRNSVLYIMCNPKI